MKPTTVFFAMAKETANSVRYEETGPSGEYVPAAEQKVGVQYVKKTTLGNPAPKRMKALFEEVA